MIIRIIKMNRMIRVIEVDSVLRGTEVDRSICLQRYTSKHSRLHNYIRGIKRINVIKGYYQSNQAF